jgi:tape measure domain-containing protein
MAVASQIIARIGADLTQFHRGMQQAKEETNQTKGFFKSAMSDMFSVAGGMLAASGISFGISSIVGLFKQGINIGFDYNAMLEQVTVAFTNVMHSSAGAHDMIQQLQQFAANTPFEFQGLAQSAQSLLAFQFNANQIKPILTAIGDTISDLGEATPDQMQRIVDIFGKINSQGKLTGETIQELADAHINVWSILEQQTGKTQAQLQKMVSQGLIPAGSAVSMLTTGMEQMYGGGMQQQATTFNGLMSTLHDNISMALGTLMGPVFDLAKQGLSQLVGWMSQPAVNDFIKGIGQDLAGALRNAGDWLGRVAGQVGTFVGNLHLGDFFQQFSGAFRDLQGAASGFHFENILGALRQFGQTIASQVLPMAFQLADWFQKQMLPAIQSVLPTALSFEQFIVNRLVPAFVNIAGWVEKTGLTISKTLLPIFQAVAPIVVRLGGFLLDMGQKALAFLIPKVEQAFKAISQFATEMSTRLQPFIANLVKGIQVGADIIGNIWNFLWPWMSKLLKLAWDDISGIINIAWQFISGLFKIFADILSGNWGQLWTDIQGLVTSVWGAVKDFIGNIWGDLKGLWDTGIGYVHDAWSGLWNGLAGIAQGAWDGVKGVIRGGINGVIDLINGMIDLADKVPGVSIPHLQHLNFAQGGIMPYSGLAMLGERDLEVVAGPGVYPVRAGSRIYNGTETQQLFGGAKGTTIVHNHNYNGVTDIRALRKILIQEAQRDAALYGGHY